MKHFRDNYIIKEIIKEIIHIGCSILLTINSFRICFFKSSRLPVLKHFVVVVIFEVMHTIGTALFAFVVLPELDVIKSVMLTNCLVFIPSLFGTSLFYVTIAMIFVHDHIFWSKLARNALFIF